MSSNYRFPFSIIFFTLMFHSVVFAQQTPKNTASQKKTTTRQQPIGNKWKKIYHQPGDYVEVSPIPNRWTKAVFLEYTAWGLYVQLVPDKEYPDPFKLYLRDDQVRKISSASASTQQGGNTGTNTQNSGNATARTNGQQGGNSGTNTQNSGNATARTNGQQGSNAGTNTQNGGNAPVRTNAQQGGNIPGQLYLRTQFWNAGATLEISWLFIGNNGVIIKNPQGGVNPVNLVYERANNAYNLGQFTVAGDQMNITWADGRITNPKVVFNGNDLKNYDGGTLTKAQRFPTATINNKTYKGIVTAGRVSVSMDINFRSDGTFTSSRLGAIGGGGNVVGAAADQKAYAGTYTISGNTLTFRYQDGTTWIVLIQPYDLGNEEIIINDQLFKQK